MSDLQHYLTQRKKQDPAFADNYDAGYNELKIGVILQALRKKAGLTQTDMTSLMHTKKSAISRIENHAEDIHLSTLYKIAAILGKQVTINIV